MGAYKHAHQGLGSWREIKHGGGKVGGTGGPAQGLAAQMELWDFRFSIVIAPWPGRQQHLSTAARVRPGGGQEQSSACAGEPEGVPFSHRCVAGRSASRVPAGVRSPQGPAAFFLFWRNRLRCRPSAIPQASNVTSRNNLEEASNFQGRLLSATRTARRHPCAAVGDRDRLPSSNHQAWRRPVTALDPMYCCSSTAYACRPALFLLCVRLVHEPRRFEMAASSALRNGCPLQRATRRSVASLIS